MATHDQVINAFFKYENRYRNGSRIYWTDESDSLFSFGHHFKLAVRRPEHKGTPQEFLLNSDRYSSSTSGHQSQVIQVLHNIFPDQDFPRTSFRLIDMHRLNPHKVEVVDFSPDDYRSSYRGHDDFDDFEKKLPRGGMYWTSKDESGEVYSKHWHLVGGVLLKGPSYDQRGHREEDVFLKPQNPQAPSLFLGSTDSTGYFIAELVDHETTTMGDGFDSLVPPEIKGRNDLKRQGEFFFAPVLDPALCLELDERSRKESRHWFSLALNREQEWPLRSLRSRRRGGSFWGEETNRHQPHHTVQNMIQIGDAVYAKGTVRDREHRMMKLDTWHGVFHNRLVVAYSSTILGLGVD